MLSAEKEILILCKITYELDEAFFAYIIKYWFRSLPTKLLELCQKHVNNLASNYIRSVTLNKIFIRNTIALYWVATRPTYDVTKENCKTKMLILQDTINKHHRTVIEINSWCIVRDRQVGTVPLSRAGNFRALSCTGFPFATCAFKQENVTPSANARRPHLPA